LTGGENVIDVKTALLFDFYGQLLTEKQQEVMHLYFEGDYSLREIAEELQVSRQAVHDMIKKSRKALEDYEGKLGLAERFTRQEDALKAVNGIAESLLEGSGERADLTEKLKQIQTIISELEQEI
jgi:hypothetical protein